METLDPKDSTPRHHPRHRHALTTKASIPNFTRRKVLPISQQRPQVSALSKMLASQSSSSSNNPFTELYAAISGRADPSSSINLRIYFPHSRTHKSKSLELKVRKDASAEEVIGFGLWSYWDNGCEPKLDEGLGGEDDPKREVRLGAIGWNLRIVEDDGEVDEDFPGISIFLCRYSLLILPISKPWIERVQFPNSLLRSSLSVKQLPVKVTFILFHSTLKETAKACRKCNKIKR
jgi:hypothetical protein